LHYRISSLSSFPSITGWISPQEIEGVSLCRAGRGAVGIKAPFCAVLPPKGVNN
jgi:hypothetical protein